MRVSVIIPTMNEEASIGHVLDEVGSALAKLDGGFEVLVVDTASKDRTCEIAREKGARVVDEPRRGYGRAYKTGFKEAKGELIATLDADCTYPATDIPKLVKVLDAKKLDFITTDRLTKAEEGAMSGMHALGNWALTTGTRVLFWTPIKDSQSGMWVFRRSILRKIRLISDGMPLSEEIKIEAWHRGFRCREYPIVYRPRVGEVKLNTWRDGFRNLFFLLKKRMALWTE